jgi:hypothetical protein
MIWAWERPEKLDFLDPRVAGVAFLARTVRVRGDIVTIHPRMQPLVVAPGTAMMAVVRVESQDPAPGARIAVEHAILGATELQGVKALQIDYDARASEREFYRGVIQDLRRVLPASMPLSITALASWCESDDWISTLPVTEAVPMLFRMGAGETNLDLTGDWKTDFSAHIQGRLEVCPSAAMRWRPVGKQNPIAVPHGATRTSASPMRNQSGWSA